MRSAERRPAPNDTLRRLLREATRRLQAARVSYGHGTANARDEAAWLVLHALGLPLDDTSADLDRRLTPRQMQAARALIEERIRSRKPAAYLTHEAWLGDHRFYVDERVIVPRSFIAELLRDGLVPWVPSDAAVRRVLDLCTGSGCLAILAALKFPRARVDAADISRPALAVAKRNVANYRLQRRVRLVESDLFAGLAGARYDVILSNPPYVTAPAMRKLPAEYRNEPRLALAGGRDGLHFVRRILAEAPRHLTADGLLVVEVGHARRAVERAFPHLPFIWPETTGGDDCVFVIARTELAGAAEPAPSRRASRGAASPPLRATRSPARASGAAVARRRRSARGSAG
jgi:ribosomal protein L3 glutamine methyltransferase